MGRAAGHPKQSQRWPTSFRLRKLVEFLKVKIQTLEVDRLQWIRELQEQQKKKTALEVQLKDKAAKYLKNKKLLERIIEVNRVMAIELLNAGAAEKPPELDADFLLRFAEHKKKLSEQRELGKQAVLEAAAAA